MNARYLRCVTRITAYPTFVLVFWAKYFFLLMPLGLSIIYLLQKGTKETIDKTHIAEVLILSPAKGSLVFTNRANQSEAAANTRLYPELIRVTH